MIFERTILVTTDFHYMKKKKPTSNQIIFYVPQRKWQPYRFETTFKSSCQLVIAKCHEMWKI